MRKKQITLCVLLAVFAVVSITAVLVSRHEEKVEQIKNSGKTILSIPTDTVTAPSWTNEDGTFSFTKGDTWTYDGDSAFPVDEGKINDLLALLGGGHAGDDHIHALGLQICFLWR